ncbi:MAG: C-GCAxxG-C-C family protein [Desulfarculus sp.]|nr:C-GCAxxG-C-C family protein [Pseudomonadota bacterium]MBV1715796.1 C-GCAxxG-C-C family protein [Desulfarculus sp.]MBU4573870.1 C-GCAxxG-C-C family protein [Pseudomonadota bacterium]MBU4597333.1 C-GCAxxG-C-C family protein [Pseudomonadota bacterium]MBV1739151.1 C-GCAxxG-C-C family protein [Desulfarculus sp.]
MGQEKLGIEDPDMIRAVGAYGGGIASTGRTCGILLGAIAAVSARYSKSRPDEKDDSNMWRLSFKLSKTFEKMCEPYGGTDCKDIARVEWRDKDQVKTFYGQPDSRRQICTKLTGDLAAYLGEILEAAEAEAAERKA